MKLTYYVSILAISAMLASCSKIGPTGVQGPSGANGVSNITITTYIIADTSWTAWGANTWEVPTKSAIRTTDAVNVYVSTNGAEYTPLPTSPFLNTGDYLTYKFGNGGTVTLWDYSNPSSPASSIYVEVADIPPGINVKYPNVDWKNYTQVSALPEFQAALAKVK